MSNGFFDQHGNWIPQADRNPLDGPFMTARDLTSYPEALDEPRPEGTPSKTAVRMTALLKGD
jgi:hypothetical protein